MITIFTLMLGTLFSAQTLSVGKINVTMTNATGTGLFKEENDVKITYTPTDYFWKLEIENKSDKTIEIDWDRSTFNYQKKVSKIVFSTTSKLLANQPKGKESIPKGMILKKEIYPLEYISFLPPTLSKSDIKKWGKTEYSINIAVIKDSSEFEIFGEFQAEMKVK